MPKRFNKSLRGNKFCIKCFMCKCAPFLKLFVWQSILQVPIVRFMNLVHQKTSFEYDNIQFGQVYKSQMFEHRNDNVCLLENSSSIFEENSTFKYFEENSNDSHDMNSSLQIIGGGLFAVITTYITAVLYQILKKWLCDDGDDDLGIRGQTNIKKFKGSYIPFTFNCCNGNYEILKDELDKLKETVERLEETVERLKETVEKLQDDVTQIKNKIELWENVCICKSSIRDSACTDPTRTSSSHTGSSHTDSVVTKRSNTAVNMV